MEIKEINYLQITQSFNDIFDCEFIENKNAGELKTHLHNELTKQGVYSFRLELGLYAIILQFEPRFKERVLKAFKICKSF